MDYDKIKLEIVAKDGNKVFSDDIVMANFPGELGVFTILPGHTPFMSALKKGEIKFKVNENDKYKYASVIEGFCEVNNEQINVITNASELAEHIDIDRAQKSKQRAERRLKERNEKINYDRAQESLARAMVRISAYSAIKK
jgi:F-type H+-transporting ATPase subunit epsilon